VQFQRISQAQLNLQRQNVSAITRQLQVRHASCTPPQPPAHPWPLASRLPSPQARVTGQIAVLNATFAANATLRECAVGT